MTSPSHDPAVATATWTFVLYVAGMTATAERALQNMHAIGKSYLDGRYSILVVDILEPSDDPPSEQVFAVPTLVRTSPTPVRKVIGDLSNTEKALQGLGITPGDSAFSTKVAE